MREVVVFHLLSEEFDIPVLDVKISPWERFVTIIFSAFPFTAGHFLYCRVRFYISLSNVYAIWKTLVATIIVFVGDRKGGRAILRHFPIYFMSLKLVFITFECNVDSLMSLFIIFDFHPVCSSSNKHVQAAFRSCTRHRHQPLGQPILCQQPVCQQSPLLQETGMPSGTMMTRLWFHFGFAHRGAKGSHAKQIKFVL